ncbi:Ankyrin repeat domain-containing protein 44 [Rhizophlyctis rosea]|uniref:Ankyrin repeat domain-containing protein 44 n=1 Tax=Rhizophlyctis rosea TaxID=64517 RepID=A0AAD5SGN1_9FUNG|nr:Ankyrin repeat domain-containing protein 44 [Rhizophlyctis rosea]
MAAKAVGAFVVVGVAVAGLYSMSHQYFVKHTAEKEARILQNKLLESAKSPGDSALFKQLLQKARYPKTDVRDQDGNTPFILACQHGNIDAIRQIISLVPTGSYATSPVLTAVNNAGHTGVHAAAAVGNVESVKYLTGGHSTILAMALTSFPAGKSAHTPLHVAAACGQLDVVKVLVKSRCDVDLVDKEGMTALMTAALDGHASVVSELLQANSDVGILDTQKRTCLHYAAISDSSDVVKTLLDHRERLLKESKKKASLKPAAGAMGRPRASTNKLRSPNQHTEDILTAVDENGKTALMFAVEHGSEDVTKLLVSAGSDLTRRDDDESTLLHLAAKSGDDKTLQLILERLPVDSIWHVDAFGRTPAHIAAQYASTSCLSVLCTRPTFPALYVAEKDDLGRTPLHSACLSVSSGTPNIVRTLLSISTSLAGSEDDEARTSLHLVCESAGDESAREVVAELLAAEADVTKEDRAGWTAMHFAASHVGSPTYKYLEMHIAKTNPDFMKTFQADKAGIGTGASTEHPMKRRHLRIPIEQRLTVLDGDTSLSGVVRVLSKDGVKVVVIVGPNSASVDDEGTSWLFSDELTENPARFYQSLRRELLPLYEAQNTESKVAIGHLLSELVRRGKLQRCFVFDVAGFGHGSEISPYNIIYPYGSILRPPYCATCHDVKNVEQFWQHVARGEVMRCERCVASNRAGGVVRPDVRMQGDEDDERVDKIGRSLRAATRTSDLVIIVGEGTETVTSVLNSMPRFIPRLSIGAAEMAPDGIPVKFWQFADTVEIEKGGNYRDVVVGEGGGVERGVKDVLEACGW